MKTILALSIFVLSLEDDTARFMAQVRTQLGSDNSNFLSTP